MSDLEKGRFIIDLDTALTYAKAWRDPNGTYKFTELHGFLMAKENLEDLLSQTPDAIRAYLGIGENGEAKLMLVGTKWNGPTESHNDMLPGDEQNPGEIFDFTRPCPKACGYMSPFNDLTEKVEK